MGFLGQDFRELAELIAAEAALAGESDDPQEWEKEVAGIEVDLDGVYAQGAQAMAAIIGMAEAIRAREAEKQRAEEKCRHRWRNFGSYVSCDWCSRRTSSAYYDD